MKNKSLVRLLSIGTMFILALTAPAPQSAADPAGVDKNEHGQSSGPKVEKQLKFLTERLDLAVNQQAKIKPILQELHDALQKIMQDESLTDNQRLDNVRTLRLRGDKQIREILNDDQRKKLDQVEAEPHPELHDN
jgi:Spy/CpxP family protein refolding chaperone